MARRAASHYRSQARAKQTKEAAGRAHLRFLAVAWRSLQGTGRPGTGAAWGRSAAGGAGSVPGGMPGAWWTGPRCEPSCLLPCAELLCCQDQFLFGCVRLGGGRGARESLLRWCSSLAHSPPASWCSGHDKWGMRSASKDSLPVAQDKAVSHRNARSGSTPGWPLCGKGRTGTMHNTRES